MSIVRFGAIAALALVSLSASALTAPVASYNFANTFASSVAGTPALTVFDPLAKSGFGTDTVFGQSRTVYNFSGTRDNAGQAGLGLNVGSLLSSTSIYTVEMVFKFTEQPGSWRRILDVENRQTDNGFYVNPSNNLAVYPVAGGAAFSNNAYHDVFLSNNNGVVTFYLDGSAQATVTTAVMNLSAEKMMYLFLDNIAGPAQGEYSSGSIASFNLYNAALTPADAGPVLPPVTAVPEPATIALMLGGLGVVGTFARRRRSR